MFTNDTRRKTVEIKIEWLSADQGKTTLREALQKYSRLSIAAPTTYGLEKRQMREETKEKRRRARYLATRLLFIYFFYFRFQFETDYTLH